MKIKGMNRDAKNSQRVFMFFYSGVDKSKTRIYKEQWLKKQYPLDKIQLATTYPIKVNGAKTYAALDQTIIVNNGLWAVRRPETRLIF